MGITFNNAVGVGFNFVTNGSDPGTGEMCALANPTDIGAGKLVIELFAAQGSTGTIAAQSVSLPNIAGEVERAGSLSSLSVFDIDMRILSAAISSAPTNCNISEATGGNRRTMGAVLVISGHDTTTPFPVTPQTQSGNSNTITFPDLGSLPAGSRVFRWAIIGKDDWTTSFSSFSGDASVISDPQSGNFRSGFFLGYDDHASAGVPGTKTLTLNGSFNWKSYSIAVASASDSTAPTLTTGPSVSNANASGFDIGGTADEGGTAMLLVTSVGASQPSDAAFDASTETTAITAATPFIIHHNG